MAALRYEQARQVIIEQVGARARPAIEEVPLEEAPWRVLAEPVLADRDYPPVARSIRDGFAVRSQDLPGKLLVRGEVRAGESYRGAVGPGEAIEIMTGAPVPEGADQIVMVEHAQRIGDQIVTSREPRPGEFINPRGSEAREGELLLEPGARLDYSRIALLAMVGKLRVRVYRRPVVAILPTGDEVVPVDVQPQPFEVRNSNAYSLAAQVSWAGGSPWIVGIARDDYQATRQLIEQALQADLLLLSGGVSMGKYDLVKQVLKDLGAEFYFDHTLIQPGYPTVFGRLGERFFFGLPGNPVSTMVTFRLFAQAALELLGGQRDIELPLTLARLTQDFRHQPGRTRFWPARLSADGVQVTPLAWQGSSDIVAVARANAFLVADLEQEQWRAGELIPVLLK